MDRKQKTKPNLKKIGAKNKLSSESINTWISYYRTHSGLSKEIMESKMRDEKKIKELSLKHKLGHKKVLEWVGFYQKYSSLVPTGFIKEQIQQGKDISLENVIKKNNKRTKHIEEFALKNGYDVEDSEMWGKICTKMPHIRSSVIEDHMKAETGKKKYTPDEFQLIIGECEMSNAILHSLGKCFGSKSYDRHNIHRFDLQHGWEIDISGDVSSHCTS